RSWRRPPWVYFGYREASPGWPPPSACSGRSWPTLDRGRGREGCDPLPAGLHRPAAPGAGRPHGAAEDDDVRAATRSRQASVDRLLPGLVAPTATPGTTT